MKNRVSAIILSAGKSQRMGRPKAFLAFDDKQCFAAKIAREFYSFGIEDIIFVTNNDLIPQFEKLKRQWPYFKIALNKQPEMGRFSSFLCGIQAASSSSEFYFIHNADMPVFDRSLLEHLWKEKYAADCLVPRNNGRGGHPILINKTIARAAENQKLQSINFRDFLSQFSRAYAEVKSEAIHFNINTPEDYAAFLKSREITKPTGFDGSK
jgi:CTP:molybdopterin cytidylyltransferase MocA